jgi:hypothetical protein
MKDDAMLVSEQSADQVGVVFRYFEKHGCEGAFDGLLLLLECGDFWCLGQRLEECGVGALVLRLSFDVGPDRVLELGLHGLGLGSLFGRNQLRYQFTALGGKDD